jgi:hypothetical protein
MDKNAKTKAQTRKSRRTKSRKTKSHYAAAALESAEHLVQLHKLQATLLARLYSQIKQLCQRRLTADAR